MCNKPKVIFVLGGPGAGKGTLCAKLVSYFNFNHLSAGDLLREEREKPGSEYGALIEHHISNGTIVPVFVTCKLIEKAMQQQNKNTSLFLIDGFPRNKDNVDGWIKEMNDKTELLFVLFLECPIDTCVERCLKRGAAGSGRTDDNIESLKKRIVTFNEDTLPIIEFYKQQNLVKTFDSSKTPQAIFEDVKKYIEEIKK
ncbi:hypothetical protein PGB90_003713 [Kerria lacca]